jgi:hypothetical protein
VPVLSIRSTDQPPPKTATEIVVEKANTPTITLAVAVSASTALFFTQDPEMHPGWRHLGREVVCPGLWLWFFFSTQPRLRKKFEDFNDSQRPIRGVAYLAAATSLAVYAVWFLGHLPPAARIALTGFSSASEEQIVESITPVAGPPPESAPPMPSELLPPTQSKEYLDMKADRDRERAENERLRQQQRSPARSATPVPTNTATGLTPSAPSTSQPQTVERIPINHSPPTTSCAQIGKATFAGRDGSETNILNQEAAVETEYQGFMDRVVAAARNVNRDGEDRARVALGGWSSERENDIDRAYGTNTRLDFQNTPASEEAVEQLRDVPISDSSKNVIRRASSYLACWRAIVGNIRARRK